MGNFCYNFMLKMWLIPPLLGTSDLFTPVSKMLKYPKVSIDTFRILVNDHDFFQVSEDTKYLDNSVS